MLDPERGTLTWSSLEDYSNISLIYEFLERTWIFRGFAQDSYLGKIIEDCPRCCDFLDFAA